jgi:hypothetical protein
LPSEKSLVSICPHVTDIPMANRVPLPLDDPGQV